MSADGPGELHLIDGNLDAAQYVTILEDVLLPSIRERFPHNDTITIVQDRSPIHKSHVVRRWLDQVPDIVPLPWPPCGADMNPIENLWAEMVRDWEAVRGGPHAIFHQALRRWDDLKRSPDFCESCVTSMPRRLQKVIDVDGNWSGY